MAKSYRWAWLFAALLLVSGWTATMSRADENTEDVTDDADEYEDVERAHLIVRKWSKDELVVQGRNVTVTVDIFNSGPASAKAIQLKDNLPPGASLVEGSLDASFPILSSGSSVQNKYVMIFTTGGSGLALPVATVTYQPEEGATQVGHSTTIGLFVMTPVQQITRYAILVGSYASLGIARSPSDWRNIAIVLGLVGAVVGGQAVMKASSKASVSRKRQRALKELEKDE